MRNLETNRAKWMRVRVGLLVCLLGVGFTRLVGAAWDLQVRRAPALREEAEQQYTRHVELSPRRGTIYDRHHNPLAVSVASPSLAANPRRLTTMRNLDIRALAARLAEALSLPPSDVFERLSSRRGFVWIKRHMTPDEHTRVQDIMRTVRIRNRDGLEVLEESRRWYPNREVAAHIVGFVSGDGHGLEGLERSMDEQLRGRTVNVQGLRDARGNLVYAEGLTPGMGQAGDDVTLTLDSTIQHLVERELALTCQVFEARGGSVIVTDPNTGEVLALASYPTYNPNEFSVSDPDARRNRAIADRFEPGSTMKVFSVGGALDEGAITPSQEINCYGGTYEIGDLTIHDSHPESMLTPRLVIGRSSNIGAAQIGLSLGADRLERVFRRFGFGERTGLPLPGEARARFGERRWYDVEVATVSFGQGIGVTSIQLAQALGAVANGGRLVRPLLVSRVTDAMGALVQENAPDTGRTALQAQSARLLADMLTSVTEDQGTGVEAAIPGVRVAGKTGTAQKAREHAHGYDDQRWVSSFIGFAPAERPRLVVTVVIDEPQITHAGGAVAAPLFRRVMEQSLRFLGALPGTQRSMDFPRGASPTPATAATAPRRNARTATAPCTMPELRNQSARAALQTLHERGLRAQLTGSGVVVRQEPAAGTACTAIGEARVWLEPGGGYVPVAQGAPAATEVRP
jgi:cell division protein FtsI (penicillin-binding protein 3)